MPCRVQGQPETASAGCDLSAKGHPAEAIVATTIAKATANAFVVALVGGDGDSGEQINDDGDCGHDRLR